MKLAEALLRKTDLQETVASLQQRITNNATVQQGSNPNEDPSQLLKTAFGSLRKLRGLIEKIHLTNAQNTLEDGRSLTQAIIQQDELKQQHSLLVEAIASASRISERHSAGELKWIPCLNIKRLQEQADDLQKEIRSLRALIQKTNWET
ncbi:MAG: DIP1984 family protein, partial [Chthoniobacterales bacterium]